METFKPRQVRKPQAWKQTGYLSTHPRYPPDHQLRRPPFQKLSPHQGCFAGATSLRQGLANTRHRSWERWLLEGFLLKVMYEDGRAHKQDRCLWDTYGHREMESTLVLAHNYLKFIQYGRHTASSSLAVVAMLVGELL